MVRRGWTQVEVPGGWLQLVRGPRPKSEQWPMQSGRSPSAAQVPGKPPVKGRWRSGVVHRRREDVSAAKVLESAMAALGPEDGATKAGLEAALRRAKEQHKGVSPGRAPVPEVTFEAARVRVQKIGSRSPRNDRFPRSGSRYFASSSDTRQSCRGPTSSECAVDTVPTIHRADCEAHRGAGQSARNTESRRLQEGRQRLQRLQQEAVAGAPTVSDRPAAPDMASEVVRLQDQVAHLQAQLATTVLEGVPATVGVPRRQCAGESIEERSSPTRRFHVPDSGGTHSMDRCEAVGHSARRRHRQCNRSQQAGRFDGRRNRAVEELDIESIHVDSHGGVNFEHLQVRSPRQVHAKYGLRGIRVGEAAHPGPPSSRRRCIRGNCRLMMSRWFQVQCETSPPG